jgi:hypothetical protein
MQLLQQLQVCRCLQHATPAAATTAAAVHRLCSVQQADQFHQRHTALLVQQLLRQAALSHAVRAVAQPAAAAAEAEAAAALVAQSRRPHGVLPTALLCLVEAMQQLMHVLLLPAAVMVVSHAAAAVAAATARVVVSSSSSTWAALLERHCHLLGGRATMVDAYCAQSLVLLFAMEGLLVLLSAA